MTICPFRLFHARREAFKLLDRMMNRNFTRIIPGLLVLSLVYSSVPSAAAEDLIATEDVHFFCAQAMAAKAKFHRYPRSPNDVFKSLAELDHIHTQDRYRQVIKLPFIRRTMAQLLSRDPAIAL